MKVSEFLEKSGWTKAELARHLGITPAAVSQWDNIPPGYTVHLEDTRSPPPPVKRVDPKSISDLELLKVIRTRGKDLSDFDICQAHGWRVPEFNQMIADLTKKYPLNGQKWGDHEFWGQVKGSCES